MLRLFFVTLAFLFSSSAQAEIFAEPIVGISKFEFKSEVSGTETQRISTGFFLAGRLGFSFSKKYFIAGEYVQAGPYADMTVDDVSLTNRLLGATVGGNFDTVRVSASYYFSNVLDQDSTTVDNEGTAFRIGLGLPVAKTKFWANLDVIFHLIEDSTDSFGTTTSFNVQTAMVSMSFPLNF